MKVIPIRYFFGSETEPNRVFRVVTGSGIRIKIICPPLVQVIVVVRLPSMTIILRVYLHNCSKWSWSCILNVSTKGFVNKMLMMPLDRHLIRFGFGRLFLVFFCLLCRDFLLGVANLEPSCCELYELTNRVKQ